MAKRDFVPVSLYLPRSLVEAYREEAFQYGDPFGRLMRRSLMGDVGLLQRMLEDARPHLEAAARE